MTKVDLVVAAIVIFGALVGLKVGALKQLTRFVAWLAAMVVPYFLAAPVARFLEKPLGVAFTISYAFSAVSLALLSYTAVAVAIWAFTRDTRKKTEDTGSPVWLANRVGGGLFGAAKATLMVWVVLSALLVLALPFLHRDVLDENGGGVVALVRHHNFWELAFHQRVEKVESVMREVSRIKPGQRASAAARSLQNDPRIRAIQNNPRLKAALARGDMASVLRSPQVLSLVTDPSTLEKLAGAAQEAALSEATARTHR